MNQTTINFSKQKRIKLIALCLVLILALAALCYFILTSEKIKLGYLLPAAALLVLGLTGLIIAVKDFLKKDQTGLSITNNGIHFAGTATAKKIGFVPWRDITSMKEGVAQGVPFISLALMNPQNYAQSVPQSLQKSVFENGLIVNSSELEIDHEGLKRLLLSYFNKFN